MAKLNSIKILTYQKGQSDNGLLYTKIRTDDVFEVQGFIDGD